MTATARGGRNDDSCNSRVIRRDHMIDQLRSQVRHIGGASSHASAAEGDSWSRSRRSLTDTRFHIRRWHFRYHDIRLIAAADIS